MPRRVRSARSLIHTFRPSLLRLEDRVTPAAPATPVIIEPFAEGQTTGTFDINMQTDPGQYFDADGHAWAATDWKIRETAGGTTVWELPYTSAPPLTFYRVDFSDGQFVNSLAGKTELNYSTNYQLVVRYRDSNNEVSAEGVRNFTTAGPTQPVPNAGQWLVRPGYALDVVQTGMRLPVNITFVPNPGPNPTDPLYYVNELYGSIQVVLRNGTKQTFATGLLDYNPQGPISGSGEQGMTGLAVQRDTVNPNIYHLFVGMLWDNGSPPAAPNHYPKVERLTSTVGGQTLNTRTLLLNMQPETQGQSHIISNITIGPDGKLYVHMGDGFDSATALNLDQYRGKVLRMNLDGTPVATGDPAGANPLYNAGDGINSRDYIYTYGHRNPFGGAWDPATNKHWVVENGNSLDRMVDLTSGGNYGWNGNDSTLNANSKFVWNPSTAPVNMAFVANSIQGGSQFPAEALGHAYVTLSGSTYSSGPLQRSKGIVEFPDLVTVDGSGKLVNQPSFLVKYNGTGRATTVALAAGPDGLYFSDLYEDTGAGGATGVGANIYRVRYVGNVGGQVPSIDTPAAATPNPVTIGNTVALSVLGADDGGENNLVYTWGLQGSPPAPVTYSANANNAAKNTVATFTANGSYTFYVAARDAGGQSAISTVTVNVTSVLTETGDGLNAQYWSNVDFTGTTITRVDPAINFNFGTGGPGTVGTNTFSARWTGYIIPRYSETYTFYTTSDDGARLWVNNLSTLLINAWFDQSATQAYTGNIALTAGVLYPIKMEYYENTGNASVKLEWSSPSQALQVVPQGRLYTSIPLAPAAPTGLILSSPSSNQINLSWTDNANNESGFKIDRSTDGVNYNLLAYTGQNLVNFSDTGLQAGTTYHYRVRSTNPSGDSSFISANLPTRPAVPLGLNAIPGDGQVQLSWVAVTGATSYRVYRGTTPGGQGVTPIATGLTSPSFLDTGLTNGQAYYYKVTAVNAGGEGAASEETVAVPPGPPLVSSFSVNAGNVQRSMVTTLRVTFNHLVNAAGGAFVLTDLAGTPVPNVTILPNVFAVSGQTVADLTFTGSAVVGGSLPDGRYRLRVLAGSITNQSPPNTPMSADATYEFLRYFGDANGDGTVSGSDFNHFRTAFGGTDPIFDFDGDGSVSGNDFNALRERFGGGV